MNELVKEMPSNAVVAFLPASFMPQENWVTLQRAYLAAQALGVILYAGESEGRNGEGVPTPCPPQVMPSPLPPPT